MRYKSVGIRFVATFIDGIVLGAAGNILRIVDSFFFYLIGAILIWSSDKKQRLGDMAVHTVVVDSTKNL